MLGLTLAVPALFWSAFALALAPRRLAPITPTRHAHRLPHLPLHFAPRSWVAGTRTQALLELSYPKRSVFYSKVFSVSFPVPSNTNAIVASWEAKLAADAVQFAVVDGGAAGDPASLGVAWILAEASAGSKKGAYKNYVTREVTYLTKTVPKTSAGAISHRPPGETAQLWADNVYMVPPFLAYYGVTAGKTAYITAAYKQIKLYRDQLRDSSSGLWKHVALGDWQSNKLWSPGNGWVAAGIVRVIATINHSEYASSYKSEVAYLEDWAVEVVTAAFAQIRTDDLLPNVFGVKAANTFSDASASALLASAAYRLAFLGVIDSNSDLIATAEKLRAAVEAGVGSDGWLAPVSDPLSFTTEGSESPEAEAFVLLMEAAWVDWKGSA